MCPTLMNEPTLHLCIPTYNRSHLVEEAICSLQLQDNAGPRWRLLVVDNASSDDTPQRLARLQRKWPRLITVRENRQGLSHARNRGIAECASGWILFADDECTFPTDYVSRALSVIDRYAPVLFGGPVYPRYHDSPPRWWRDNYGTYSIPSLLGRSDRIFFSGGNMGYSVAALRKLGGFDPHLGMRGNRLGYGEETAVEEVLLQDYPPQSIHYDPDLFNFHLVRPEKYQWSHLLHEHFSRGLSRAYIKNRTPRTSSHNRTEQIIPPSLLVTKYPRPRAANRHPLGLLYEKGLPLLRLIGYWSGRLFGSGQQKKPH